MTFLDRAKLLAYRLGEPLGDATLADVDALVADFYALDGNDMGGKLHIVLDDENIETRHVEWCREEARKAGDEEAFWLVQVLLALTIEQRAELAFCSCCRDELREAIQAGEMT